MTMTIQQSRADVRNQLKLIRSMHPRATARILDADDVNQQVDEARRILKQRGITGVYTFTVYGGFVAGKYKYRPTADVVQVRITLDEWNRAEVQSVCATRGAEALIGRSRNRCVLRTERGGRVDSW